MNNKKFQRAYNRAVDLHRHGETENALSILEQLLTTAKNAKFATGERIDDASLRKAIERADAGKIDADLGGNLIKQRVARKGAGTAQRLPHDYRVHRGEP